MKPAKVTFRIFCIAVIALTLFGAIASPALVAAGNPDAPRQQGGSILYLPVVMAPLTPLIPETTNVLTDATTQHLTSISAEGAFTFAQITPELANVVPGEVIAGGVSLVAPNGFLRRVTAISNVSGQVVVQTTGATLEDAIEQGEVFVSRVLSPTDIQNSVLASGVTLPEQGEFFFKVKDVVLYDEDGNQQTKGDQILANGSITLSPEFEVDAIISQWQLKQFVFIHRAHETAELEIEARVAAVSLKRKVEIARHYFTPITIYIVTPLVIFPVVITPVLTVYVGVDGSVHAGICTGVTQQATLTAGVRYVNSTWNPVNEFSHSFQFTPPTLSAGLDLKGYGGPQLALLVYGVAGPYVEVNAYLKLEADLFNIPWWKLYGGLEAPLGVKVEILGVHWLIIKPS